MKAIFFDIFGTVVDWRSSIVFKAKKLGVFNNKIPAIEKFVIMWRKEYQPILNKVNKSLIDWKTLDELHGITLDELCKKMKITEIKKKEKKYLINQWHKLEPWSDSCEGLNELSKEYLTASLSNGNIKLQKNLIRHAKLKFDFIFSAEHFKKYKPHKKVYLGATEMLNFHPNQCALVASHKNDLLAASKIGMKTIFINRKDEYGKFKGEFKETNFNPDIKVSKITDISKEIKSYLGRIK